MTIAEAARQSGLSADSIRFYERVGALPKPPRAANGYRQYTGQHVSALRLAKRLRDLDVPLEDVGRVIEVAHEGQCGELRGELIGTLRLVMVDVEQRLRELRECREQLGEVLDGLLEMEPADEMVPGLVACECVQIATGEPERAAD
jgi:MerR family transcriptional regulator, copper efflux regulator